MITKEQKQKIVSAIKEREPNFGSAAKMAIAMGINKSLMSRIKNGETDNVLSDANWISIARRLNVELNEQMRWVTAQTETFKYIYSQLRACKELSVSSLLCDMPGIGKSYTARCFCNETPHSVYIDCSQYKSKQRLVRAIAQNFGSKHTGRYADVYEDLVFYLKSLNNPLVILDEAGDLGYDAFLELKALWNATEHFCGWYMMGADGLRIKIERLISAGKVGYAEIFRRYGEGFKRATPVGADALTEYLETQVAEVAKVNGVENTRQLSKNPDGSLTRTYIEIKKLKLKQAA